MLAFCVMAVSLVFTLAVTAANLRLTYVTDLSLIHIFLFTKAMKSLGVP